jgi:hypothetical protein
MRRTACFGRSARFRRRFDLEFRIVARRLVQQLPAAFLQAFHDGDNGLVLTSSPP